MAFERKLTLAEQLLLADWILLPVQCASEQRLQSIFKHESSLVPSTSTRAMKLFVSNPKQVAGTLVERLQDRSTQHRACVALQQVVQAAWKSHTLDNRVRQRFIESSAALRGGNWERLRRLSDRLDDMRADETTEHPLLAQHQRLILLESGIPERVFSTLEFASGDGPSAGSPGALPEAPALFPDPVPQEQAPPAPPVVAAIPPPATASPSSAVAGSPPPSKLQLQEWVDSALSGLHSLDERARAPDPRTRDLSGLVEVCRAAADFDLPEDAPATELRAALERLRTIVGEQIAILDRRVRDATTARRAATEALQARLSGQGLQDLGDRWGGVQALLMELPADIAARILQDVVGDTLVPEVLEHIEGEHATWLAEQARSREAHAALEVLARIQGISVEELQRRLSGAAAPVLPVAPAVVEAPIPAPVSGLAFPPGHPFPSSFPRSGLLTAEAKTRNPQRRILPLVPDAGFEVDSAPDDLRATAAGATLVRFAHQYGVDSLLAPSAIIDLLKDAAALAGPRPGEVGAALEEIVLALLLVSATPLRHSSAGRRLIRELLQQTTASGISNAAAEIAYKVAGCPGTPIVLSGALQAGMYDRCIDLCVRVQERSVLRSRLLGQDLGIAAAALSDDEPLRERCGLREGLGRDAMDRVEAWLEGFRARKRRPQPPLSMELSPWLTGFLTQRANCLYETEASGKPVLNLSVPVQVQEHGIFVKDGEERVVLPILVRNSGKAAAAGVELSITKVDGATVEPGERTHPINWLARDDLEAAQDAIVEVQAILESEVRDRVVLHCEHRISGGEVSKPRTLIFKLTSSQPKIGGGTIPGLAGQPMDLQDLGVLQRSSRTVREVYADLRDKLAEGVPVRRLVYGRRRRGKSSIRSTLTRDPIIRRHFLVGTSEWNAARMTSVESAFIELGDTIVRALALRDISARAFSPEGLTDREGLYRAWKGWLRETSSRLTEPVKVLLLIDEFQKWLAALSEVADRQTVLNAFRDFNDDSIGDQLSVAFVLFGLRNLKRLTRATNDFGNAVKSDELKALTIDESCRYIRETLPVDQDGRTQQRLARLCGGNPFVLNLLSAELTSQVMRAQRPYALVTDVTSLLEDMGSLDSRLDSFFAYMLKEDEDESAPALPQLTVLRAVASLLEKTGDYASYLRVEAVEEWLAGRQVSFEPGLPEEQLSELADIGVLDRHQDGSRYNLPGEAICRWLASRSESTAPLQPVTRQPSTEMVLNRYEIVRLLDRGGQGTRIYLARDTTLAGRQVVLKIYEGSELDLRRKVEREARLLVKAQGRYVVPLHDHGFDERKGGVLVMKWLEGRTLADLLSDAPVSARSLLPGGDPDRQVQLMMKLAEGVMCLHRAGVVHKDLSARNVVLLEEAAVWEPHLIDFGISGEVVAEEESTPDFTTDIGTARYMAPEKRLRGRARSKPSDIYSLGALFVDLTCPREPGRLPPDEIEGAGLAVGLVKLLKEMLADMPEERPTAEGVRARLEGVLDPIGWEELAESAVESYCNGEAAEALGIFQRAIAEAPSADTGGAKFLRLLDDALDCLLTASEHMDWWDMLFSAVLGHAVRAEEPMSWAKLMAALDAASLQSSTGVGVYEPLISMLERTKPHAAFEGLLKVMCVINAIVDRHADRFHYLLLNYGLQSISPVEAAVDFCAARARWTRTTGHPLTECELWLRRGRRIRPGGTNALREQQREYDAVREHTRTLQTLPPDAEEFKVTMGVTEGGHSKLDRIRDFAKKIHMGHPYVAGVQVIRKAPYEKASVPTLLGLDSASAELRGIDRDQVIPFLLDASYTSSSGSREAIPLRLAIILTKGTTSAQRQAAYDRLRDDHVLFPI